MPGLKRHLAVFLAAILLAAQQAALEHPLWHVGAADEDSPLCEQHDALDAVLGAVDCAPVVLAGVAPAAAASAAAPPPAPAAAPLEPASRGPPALL